MALISKIEKNGTKIYNPLSSGGIYTCSTASGTVNKAITGLSTSDLSDGLTIKVKFTYSNTVANPKIYVGSSTYTLYRYGTTPVGTDETSSWYDGEIVDISFVASGNTYICYLKTNGIQLCNIESELKTDDNLISSRTSCLPLYWRNVYLYVDKNTSAQPSIYGNYIWSDGENIYYSYGTTQYVYNLRKPYLTSSFPSNAIFNTKTWSGLTNFDGNNIWTDGDNIYYSSDSAQYVLNKSTSNWTTKTWSGLTSFNGFFVWTDGTNIYYSSGSTNYVLNKSTSTWSAKTWSGLTSFNGAHVWSDGNNIYYSSGTNSQYILDKANSTWIPKIWTGFTNIYGNNIWTDGDNIYYSNGENYQYRLDKNSSNWTSISWSGNISYIYGNQVWTEGDYIYYSNNTNSYYLNCIKNTDNNTMTSKKLYTHNIRIELEYEWEDPDTGDVEEYFYIVYCTVRSSDSRPLSPSPSSLSEFHELLRENGIVDSESSIKCRVLSDSSSWISDYYAVSLYAGVSYIMMIKPNHDIFYLSSIGYTETPSITDLVTE